MANVSAVANIKKNRLSITMKGSPSTEEAKKLYTEVRFGVADLSPGFDVINDMTGCSVGALSALPALRKIILYLVSNKVGRVVRVIDKRKIVFRQLLNFVGSSQGYEGIQVGSLEEAEAILSEKDNRHTMRIRLYNQSIQYVRGKEEGVGQVEDLSLTGCKVASDSIQLTKGEILDVMIQFKPHGDLFQLLEGKAEIIWVKGQEFGANFLEMNSQLKEQLWQRLVYETTLNKE